MCKVLIIPSIKEPHRQLTTSFIKGMAERMSLSNSDGLGYAAINSSGELYGERWFDNKTAFTYGEVPKVEASLWEKFSHAIKDTKPLEIVSKFEYNRFGTGSLSDATAITLHARMATCAKNLTNVHPFVKNDTSVIHNGVIRNPEKFGLEQSTCDSEAILLNYLAHDIGSNTSAMQKMVNEMVGYYVAAMFSRDANGNRVMDIFNGNNTNLYIASIKELDTYVMSTSDYDIKEVSKGLGLTIIEMYQILDDRFLRINPFDGSVIEHSTFRSGLQYEQKATTYYPPSRHQGWVEYQHGKRLYREGSFKDGEIIPPPAPIGAPVSKKKKHITEPELNYLMLAPKIEVLAHEAGLKVLGMMNLLIA